MIPILSVFNYIPNLINSVMDNKADSLIELLPDDNKMVDKISIKNVQDICTALAVSYHLDHKRKRAVMIFWNMYQRITEEIGNG